MGQFTELLKARKKQMRLDNLQEIRTNINNKDVEQKIINYCERWGRSDIEIIKQEIMSNDIVASFFAKDPSKQNPGEKLVAELTGKDKLPASGKNCIRFDNEGNIVSTNSGTTSKSADFYFNNYYITQKYTDGEGGAQDNQRNDVIDFLTKGSIKYKVGALVDGAYWDKYRVELQKLFEYNNNVIILSMDDILKGEFKIEK